jgi:hypothetical protein
MRIYVAGPMTGVDGFNLPAFAWSTERLTAAGYDAVNPGRHGVNPGYMWEDYLRRALLDMLTCDGVALLPGWEESRGARLEVDVAVRLRMPVRPVGEWLSVAAEATL